VPKDEQHCNGISINVVKANFDIETSLDEYSGGTEEEDVVVVALLQRYITPFTSRLDKAYDDDDDDGGGGDDDEVRSCRDNADATTGKFPI
jgi:hypothetical protein